jgi:hypothetical protein
VLKRVIAAACVFALLGAGTASALKIGVGNLTMNIGGGFSPKALPKKKDAPIKLQGYASIKTKDGSHPPVLQTLTVLFDKRGHVETRGLPHCTVRKLENTDVKTARRSCPKAIVGKGNGKATILFPDSLPVPAYSPITIFNGPKFKGDPTVIAHAYLTIPVPTTFTVPVRIEKIKKGRYGYRTVAKIPEIAGGYGSATYGKLVVNRKWRYKGKKLSFVNARCQDGRLQAQGFFSFNDGTELQGTLFNRCKIRR